MNFKPSTLVTLIIVLFTACANQQSKTSCEKALPMLVQSKSNTSMRIDVPEHLNDLELGKPVFIVVDNLSKAKIEVTPDNDLRIFWFKGDSWVAVKNKADYLGAIETISAKTNSDPGGKHIMLTRIFQVKMNQFKCVLF